MFLTANQFIALVIAGGYIAALIGMWYIRAAYQSLAAMGWILVPVLTGWVIFYLLVPLSGWEMSSFVWLSRINHVGQLVILALVIRIGLVILEALKEADDAER